MTKYRVIFITGHTYCIEVTALDHMEAVDLAHEIYDASGFERFECLETRIKYSHTIAIDNPKEA